MKRAAEQPADEVDKRKWDFHTEEQASEILAKQQSDNLALERTKIVVSLSGFIGAGLGLVGAMAKSQGLDSIRGGLGPAATIVCFFMFLISTQVFWEVTSHHANRVESLLRANAHRNARRAMAGIPDVDVVMPYRLVKYTNSFWKDASSFRMFIALFDVMWFGLTVGAAVFTFGVRDHPWVCFSAGIGAALVFGWWLYRKSQNWLMARGREATRTSRKSDVLLAAVALLAIVVFVRIFD